MNEHTNKQIWRQSKTMSILFWCLLGINAAPSHSIGSDFTCRLVEVLPQVCQYLIPPTLASGELFCSRMWTWGNNVKASMLLQWPAEHVCVIWTIVGTWQIFYSNMFAFTFVRVGIYGGWCRALCNPNIENVRLELTSQPGGSNITRLVSCARQQRCRHLAPIAILLFQIWQLRYTNKARVTDTQDQCCVSLVSTVLQCIWQTMKCYQALQISAYLAMCMWDPIYQGNDER